MDDDLLMSFTEDKPVLDSEFSLQPSHLYSALHDEKTSVDLLLKCPALNLSMIQHVLKLTPLPFQSK